MGHQYRATVSSRASDFALTLRRTVPPAPGWAVLAILVLVLPNLLPTGVLPWSRPAPLARGGSTGSAAAVHDSSTPLAGPLYPVTFTPVGLPRSVTWFLNVSGPTLHANGTSILVNLTNGTHAYNVTGSGGFFPTNSSGNVTVSGGAPPVNFSFFEVYPLVFTEHGLPTTAGSRWHVFVGLFEKSSNANQSITYYEPNGSYQISTGSTLDYAPSPRSATITVNGTFPPFNFNFTPIPRSSITFNEAGLPSGTVWQVTIDGVGLSPVAAPAGFQVLEPNGNYTYSAGAVGSYQAVPPAAPFTVYGVNYTIPIVFEPPPSYTVYFQPSGLSSGSWSVDVNASLTRSAPAGQTIAFTLSNGSYNYTIPKVGTYAPTPPSGVFLVTGGEKTLHIAFATVVFPVSFIEFGLPSGNWWVFVNNSNYSTPAGAGPTVELPNGTYSYTTGVDDASYLPTTSHGSFYVQGEGVTVSVNVISRSSATTQPPTSAAGPSKLATYWPYLAIAGAVFLAILAMLIWRRYRLPPAASTPPPPGSS